MLRSTLLKLSESKSFANWVTSNGTTRRMARRFVAGETLDEAIAAARECNNAGMFASLDYFGENVVIIFDVQYFCDVYLQIFDSIYHVWLYFILFINLKYICLYSSYKIFSYLVI